METSTDNYRIAKRHVDRKLRFFVHLSVYIMVNCGLVLLNLSRQPEALWSFGPLFGWGIAVLFHGLSVFLHAPGAAWKQRMIENELSKYKSPPSK